MGRRMICAATLVLTLATPVVSAQEDVRALKGTMDWGNPDRIESRPDGLTILTYNLSDEAVGQFRGKKSVFAYITYASISRPSLSNGFGVFDLTPLEFARYYYSLAVANFGTRTARGTFTLKLSGPTRWTRTFPNTTVSGRTFTVLYYQGEPLNRTGNYLLKGTFKGAGSTKSRFCAGC